MRRVFCPTQKYFIEFEMELTHSDFFKGSCHHSNKHVKKNDDSAPVVDAKHDIADALRHSTMEALHLNHARLGQAEQSPEHRPKRQL